MKPFDSSKPDSSKPDSSKPHSSKPILRKAPLLGSFLDKVMHPLRDPKPQDADPGRPFTPPPAQPSKEEKDDDDGSPPMPMDPALA